MGSAPAGRNVKINPIIPADWAEKLKEFIASVKTEKKDEYDKRAFFKSFIMEGVFGINPRYIEYEKDRVDLYYAGVLIETKEKLDRSSRLDGLRKIKKYLERRPNTKLCVLTDLLAFELYKPEDVKKTPEDQLEALEPFKVFRIDIKQIGESDDAYAVRVFDEFYSMLYPRETHLKPEPDVIVPRLLEIINRWAEKISKEKRVDSNIKFIAWKSYVSKVFGNESEASAELFVRHALLYYTSIIMSARDRLHRLH